jgi:hypothetical protein
VAVHRLLAGTRVVQQGFEGANWYSAQPRYVTLPDEAYLRELVDLDLGDDEAIVDFANTWGWIGDPGFRVREQEVDRELQAYEGYGGPDFEWVARFDAFARVGHLQEDDFVGRVSDDLLAAGYVRESFLGVSMPSGQGSAGEMPQNRVWLNDMRHLDEFILGASILRDAVRVWQAHTGALAWDVVSRSMETDPSWLDVGVAFRDDGTVDDASLVSFFCSAMNAALSTFSVHVYASLDEARDTPEILWTAGTFECLALQLADHMRGHAAYAQCANETCRRFFVRQRTATGEVGPRQVGLRFCSQKCARAEAQRQYRRRNAKGAT